MLEDKKNVFWEAFIIAIFIFALGLVLGFYIEQLRAESTNNLFYQSEISLYDSFALGKVIDNPNISCDEVKKINIKFADKIYGEAKTLEKFDSANKITDSVKLVHRKYDLLRTLLWADLINTKNRCKENVNTVVYLYIYNTDDIGIRSKQITWNRVLTDLKQKQGDNIILIPIAVDQNISSLDYLKDQYSLREFPSVIVNEKKIFNQPSTLGEIEKYLD